MQNFRTQNIIPVCVMGYNTAISILWVACWEWCQNPRTVCMCVPIIKVGRSVGWSHVCFCHTTEGDMYSCVPNVLQLFSLCNSKYPLRLRLRLWLWLGLRLRLRMNGNVKRSQGESQRVTDRRRRATEQIGISPDVIQLHFISPGRGWIWKILVANIHMRALEDYS